MEKITSIIKKLILKLIRIYQLFLSPLLGQHCRYYPSCSEYTKQAIGEYGIYKGIWLGLKRLSRCHPWHPGGVDPIPQKQKGS